MFFFSDAVPDVGYTRSQRVTKDDTYILQSSNIEPNSQEDCKSGHLPYSYYLKLSETNETQKSLNAQIRFEDRRDNESHSPSDSLPCGERFRVTLNSKGPSTSEEEFAAQTTTKSISVPAQESGDVRRYRTAFSREQLNVLETEFTKENYVSRPRRCELAKELNLPESTIKVWFQNRRMKDKRHRMSFQWPFFDPNLTAYISRFASPLSPLNNVQFAQRFSLHSPNNVGNININTGFNRFSPYPLHAPLPYLPAQPHSSPYISPFLSAPIRGNAPLVPLLANRKSSCDISLPYNSFTPVNIKTNIHDLKAHDFKPLNSKDPLEETVHPKSTTVLDTNIEIDGRLPPKVVPNLKLEATTKSSVIFRPFKN